MFLQPTSSGTTVSRGKLEYFHQVTFSARLKLFGPQEPSQHGQSPESTKSVFDFGSTVDLCPEPCVELEQTDLHAERSGLFLVFCCFFLRCSQGRIHKFQGGEHWRYPVVISQTRWLVSQERLSPRAGTSLFIDLFPITPSGEQWFFLQLVCHTTLLPHQGVLASTDNFKYSEYFYNN